MRWENLEIYEKFISKIREKNMSPAKFSREIGMSKQLFFYHLKNLKKKKITFNTEQFKKICEKLSVDANFFYK
mgnify:FL=1